MPVPFRRLPSGTILVDAGAPVADQRVVLYARVCSHDRRSDLDRQVSRLIRWATGSGCEVN
jgi:putative resolvase